MEPFYANSGVVQSWDGRRHICGVPDAGSRGSVPAVDMTKHKSPILFGIQSNWVTEQTSRASLRNPSLHMRLMVPRSYRARPYHRFSQVHVRLHVNPLRWKRGLGHRYTHLLCSFLISWCSLSNAGTGTTTWTVLSILHLQILPPFVKNKRVFYLPYGLEIWFCIGCSLPPAITFAPFSHGLSYQDITAQKKHNLV